MQHRDALDLKNLVEVADEVLKQSLQNEIDTIGAQFRESSKVLVCNENDKNCYPVLKNFLTSDEIMEIFRRVEFEEAKTYLQNRGGHLSATDASATCLRQTLFKFFGLTQIDEDKLATFALVRLHSLVGKVIHQFIQSVIPFAYTELPLFVQLDEDLIISGYVDGFYFVEKAGEVYKVVAEIKTAYDTKLTKKFTGDKKHWQQVKFYAYVLSGNLSLSEPHYLQNDEFKSTWELFSTRVNTPDFIHLIYIDKQLRLGADFIQKVQTQDFRLLEKRLNLLKESIKTLTIPSLDWKNFVDTNDCRFCPYESFCKEYQDLIRVEDFKVFSYTKPTNTDVYLKEPKTEEGE